MAAIINTPLVSVDEYIACFIDGDEEPICEYIDGVLFPKSMGTKKHSQTRMNIGRLIPNQYWPILNPLTELTTRLRPGQLYIPDLAVKELLK